MKLHSTMLDIIIQFIVPLLLIVSGLIYFLGKSSRSFWFD